MRRRRQTHLFFCYSSLPGAASGQLNMLLTLVMSIYDPPGPGHDFVLNHHLCPLTTLSNPGQLSATLPDPVQPCDRRGRSERGGTETVSTRLSSNRAVIVAIP